jgi:hypothetical protein
MAPETAQAKVRDRFVQEWLACTLRTYPAQTGHVLHDERDRFRHPVGYTLRAALGTLAAELLNDFDRSRVAAALDDVIRLRVVQEGDPDAVVGFVPLAGQVIHAMAAAGSPAVEPARLDLFAARLDELGVLANEVQARCRAQIHAIAERAARRSGFVPERMLARRALTGAAIERGQRPSALGSEMP